MPKEYKGRGTGHGSHTTGIENYHADAEPWERTEAESSRAYMAFVCYREMPPSERSIRAVCESKDSPDVSISTMNNWSAEHDWVERATKYWDEIARVREQRHIEAQAQARDLLFDKLSLIMETAIYKAVQEKNARMLDSLLDRAGITETKEQRLLLGSLTDADQELEELLPGIEDRPEAKDESEVLEIEDKK
jgi:hypothetical protein